MPLPLPEFLSSSFEIQQAGPVFCNRNLRLDQIDLVGFDMDYTLAIYRQEAMDKISIEVTVKKLVERGYPEVLLTMPYRTDFAIRGLVVDRKLGNILKMDRYRYVKQAYHGMQELSLEERRGLYHSMRLRLKSKRYHWVDTLYALSELSVFAAVIEAMEKEGDKVNYDQLFSDVRECIDLSHRDGSILDVVAADFPSFVDRDPRLADTLHRLRSSGKKLMVLTNSHAGYSNKMMQYLLGESRSEYPTWQSYFDLIVTAAKKPSFFETEQSFRPVDLETGSLGAPAETLERGVVYAGGSLSEFRRLAGIAGDRVLYVGDHIYGDVLRPKKTSAWRTAFVMQDMGQDMSAQHECLLDIEKLDQLIEELEGRHDELRDCQSLLKQIQQYLDKEVDPSKQEKLEEMRTENRRAQENLRGRIRELDGQYAVLEKKVSKHFHPLWGPLFKCGPENSILGEQVERYACIYMDRVSNLLSYSPNHYFRSPRTRMPHEYGSFRD